MKLAFISDLHLSPTTLNSNQLFFNLLMTWQLELDALYILGDFFDYWVGDDDDNTFIRQIKQALINFSRIKPIYFIGGNHDFGVGKQFARETGITLIKDCSILKVGSYTILLSHGDTFCSLDLNYQRLKKVLQNPLLMFILRKTPLAMRYKLKEKLENKASHTFNTKPAATYQVVDSTITSIANKYGANVVIHGHTHNPGHYLINHPQGVINRFEIPDWVDHAPGGYVLIEDEQIKIHLPK